MGDQQIKAVEKREPQPLSEEWLAPDVDIYETDDRLVLVVDIPGCDNPDVRVDENELSIRAKCEYAEPREATCIRAEFQPQHYRRVFNLPAGINADDINAHVENGVLRLELPKSEETKVHKIQVKAG